MCKSNSDVIVRVTLHSFPGDVFLGHSNKKTKMVKKLEPSVTQNIHYTNIQTQVTSQKDVATGK